MITDWHREDIASALNRRGWVGPERLEPEAYFEGERSVFRRGSQELNVSFVSDLGDGYAGPRSLEEAIATRHGSSEARLWLHRRRDSKWRRDLFRWADVASSA